jgi:hypothetical protein
MYLDKLKQKTKEALVNKNKEDRAFYQTLLADAELLAKEAHTNITDEYVSKAAISMKRSFDKGRQKALVEAIKKGITGNIPKPYGYELLEDFIPEIKTISQEELVTIVKAKKMEGCSIGEFMRYINTNYPNTVDKKLASQLFNSNE